MPVVGYCSIRTLIHETKNTLLCRLGKVKVGDRTEGEDDAGEDEDEQAIANQNNQESRIIEKIK